MGKIKYGVKRIIRLIKIVIFSLISLVIVGLIVYFVFIPQKKVLIQQTPLPAGTLADSIVVYKEKRVLDLYYGGKLLKSYHVSLGKNPLGHKEKEGDKKTPEGLYSISGRNPNSKYHLSLRISYPNENDKLNAENLGLSPGSDIMIHGLPNYTGFLENYYTSTDWTDGCIAVNNQEIEELWSAVNDGTPILINK